MCCEGLLDLNFDRCISGPDSQAQGKEMLTALLQYFTSCLYNFLDFDLTSSLTASGHLCDVSPYNHFVKYAVYHLDFCKPLKSELEKYQESTQNIDKLLLSRAMQKPIGAGQALKAKVKQQFISHSESMHKRSKKYEVLE